MTKSPQDVVAKNNKCLFSHHSCEKSKGQESGSCFVGNSSLVSPKVAVKVLARAAVSSEDSTAEEGYLLPCSLMWCYQAADSY